MKSGATKFEPLLATFGLGGPVHPMVRDALFEAQNLRNVFVRKGGITSLRMSLQIPAETYKVVSRAVANCRRSAQGDNVV
jgi:hypothetical protein